MNYRELRKIQARSSKIGRPIDLRHAEKILKQYDSLVGRGHPKNLTTQFKAISSLTTGTDHYENI